jgi:hypothetical protein
MAGGEEDSEDEVPCQGLLKLKETQEKRQRQIV